MLFTPAAEAPAINQTGAAIDAESSRSNQRKSRSAPAMARRGGLANEITVQHCIAHSQPAQRRRWTATAGCRRTTTMCMCTAQILRQHLLSLCSACSDSDSRHAAAADLQRTGGVSDVALVYYFGQNRAAPPAAHEGVVMMPTKLVRGIRDRGQFAKVANNKEIDLRAWRSCRKSHAAKTRGPPLKAKTA